jgi:starvation-inducible DNA-binding protein
MPNVKNLANHRKAASATGPESFPTRNDVPAAARKKVIALLDQLVADSSDLRSQVKHAHWNVKGPNFIALHKLFDELAHELGESIDELAERATALGGVIHGTTRMAAHASRLPEFPAGAFAGDPVLRALADRYAALAESTRKGIDSAEEAEDKTTADLLTQATAALDKGLWFLEAHLEDGK